MKQLPLPLFPRIIFVDWHGVISRDPFWASILKSNKHPVRHQLETKLSEIFANNTTMAEWMKGTVSSQEVISEMEIPMDGRFRQDFLQRRLDLDCYRMRVNSDLLKVLQKFKSAVFLVLATDNMDCFLRAFEKARVLRPRISPKSDILPKTESMELPDWVKVCDDIICSSDVGALKSEDPVSFFGPTLSNYGLRFANALLIDDRADNCEAFRRQGGGTIQWRMGTDHIENVEASLHRWLEHAYPVNADTHQG